VETSVGVYVPRAILGGKSDISGLPMIRESGGTASSRRPHISGGSADKPRFLITFNLATHAPARAG
jgi:hypothetical protein